MLPAQPPLPTPWSLPFHPETGSHTSILMSESLDGLSVAVTRHIAGRLANACGAFGTPPAGEAGGLNSPAPTDRDASDTCSILSDASFSQADASRLWPWSGAASPSNVRKPARSFNPIPMDLWTYGPMD